MSESPLQEPTYRAPSVYLRLTGPTLDREGIILDMHQFIKGVTTEWGIDSTFTVTFELFDPLFDWIERMIHEAGLGTLAHFSYGWADGPMTSGYYGYVKNYSAKITPGGSHVTLTIQPPYASLAAARPTIRFGYDPERNIQVPQKVSDAVDWACEVLGIPAVDRYIEPTAGLFMIPPIIGYEGMNFTSWLTSLQRLARPDRAGEYGVYSFSFDPDNVFRYASFGTNVTMRMRLYDAYVYGYANDGRVFSLELVDQRPIMAHLGGERSVARHVNTDDPDDGEVEFTQADGAREVAAEGGGYAPALRAQGLSLANGALPVEEIVSAADEARIRTRQAWTLYSGYSFHLRMTILGDPHIAMSDLIYIRVIKRDGIPHFLSGFYCIKRVAHTISTDSFITEVVAIRRASSIGDLVAANITIPAVLGENRNVIGDASLPSIRMSPNYRFVLGNAYRESDERAHAVFETNNIELSRRLTARMPGYIEPPLDFNVPRPYTPTPRTNHTVIPEGE